LVAQLECRGCAALQCRKKPAASLSQITRESLNLLKLTHSHRKPQDAAWQGTGDRGLVRSNTQRAGEASQPVAAGSRRIPPSGRRLSDSRVCPDRHGADFASKPLPATDKSGM
jgi:hypothetical protein